MKRISIYLAVLALMLILPITALAEGESEATPSPGSTATAQDDTQDDGTQMDTQDAQENTEEGDDEDGSSFSEISFSIDNDHVYDGMDKAYKDGYSPTVQDGSATVILPLIASGEIKDNAITVTPELGDTSSSPFVYKNYQKTVTLADNNVINGGAVSSYLIRFDLPLTDDRYNGVYAVTINVEGQGTDGSTIQQGFTCYVTITDGADPNAETEIEEETPESQPKIIVSAYSVNPSPVTAGEECTVTVTLKNTSDTQSVKNMMVTVASESPGLTLQNDSSTIYVGKLSRGDTTDIELAYKTDLATAAGRYNLTLTMEYDSSDTTMLSSSGTVMVEVAQPLRVEMDAPDMETEVNAGDTIPLSFQVMNMGRSAVYNVRIELEAPGLIPSETAFIGNMEAGTSMTGEMDVFVGTKNMSEGYEGDEKYGYTSGTITLIYEDEEGNEYTEEVEISTTINEPVITVSTDDEEEDEQETAGQWWISIVIGCAVIAGLAAYIIIRKKRQEQHDEDI